MGYNTKARERRTGLNVTEEEAKYSMKENRRRQVVVSSEERAR